MRSCESICVGDLRRDRTDNPYTADADDLVRPVEKMNRLPSYGLLYEDMPSSGLAAILHARIVACCDHRIQRN